MVLDHIAKPDIAHGGFETWSKDIREMARRENVICKLSGMVTEADWKTWTPEQLKPYFDTVLEGMKPRLSFAVENKLSDDPNAPQLKVDLRFKKLDDFEPGNVAKQVTPLKELLALRTRLADLRGTLQGNDKLEEVLLEAVGNTEKLDKLKGEISPTKEGGSNG